MKIGNSQNLKSTVMDGNPIRKVGKSENFQNDEERRCQNEEKLCKSIIKGSARRNREKHAILAEIEEKQRA